MAEKNIKFQLTFPENQKKDANLFSVDKFTFDDLGDFIEERERLRRLLERRTETELRVDFSSFENHVFFDSAVAKHAIAKDRVLKKYPFNGTTEEKDNFNLTGSGYDKYIFDIWPRSVGYLHLDGVQYVSASDVDNKLILSSASLYVSAWIEPSKTIEENLIIQVGSGSVSGSPVRQGYDFYLSGATDPHLKFTLFSGASSTSVSAAFTDFTSSFNNVAAIYDNTADLLSLYVNKERVASASVAYSPINFKSSKLLVGSGSKYSTAVGETPYTQYTGSINEVRIFHTASELYHQRSFDKPVNADSGLKLRYSFNEGLTETGSFDQVVVDYSKSSLHGLIVGYTSDTRVSASVMVNEPGDPILYSFHPNVVSFNSEIELSASLYDNNNNNNIFNMIPEAILIEDELAEGLLEAFVLAMARYFDEIKCYIDQFDNLRITNYSESNETPDLFLPFLQRYFGWKVADYFGDASPASFFLGDNVISSGTLDVPLVEIKNQFWRRTLNNLPYLMKTKGNRTNLDAYFNILGINKENINVKEYGYLPGSSIQDDRIDQQRVVSALGIGTGSDGLSFTGSHVVANSVYPSGIGTSGFTIETMVQPSFPSSSYTNTVNDGQLWQLQSNSDTEAVRLFWQRSDLESETGKFVMETTSGGTIFSSSDLSVFDGQWLHVSAGRYPSTNYPFISLRGIEGCDIILSEDFTGSAVFGIAVRDFDLVIGANSGSVFTSGTQGFFGEVRAWDRVLSGSELDDHALDLLSVGIRDPLEEPHPLLGHWALNEEITTNVNGNIHNIVDLSRNGFIATGSDFPPGENAYQKFLRDVNPLSPSMDLKWTGNKVRIRNTTKLKPQEHANDTNEVALEFNLVDSLNRDISKIFSTFEQINDVIGAPINKYRDEYADLEGYRSLYFDRLGDSLNFNNFFKLFKWFDKKLSDSIKQLLPSRVKFIGGEQVVESHFLERSKYGYKYPIFRTPQEVPEIEISSDVKFSGAMMTVLPNSPPATVYGTSNRLDRIKFPPSIATDNFSQTPEQSISTRGSTIHYHCDDEVWITTHGGVSGALVPDPNSGLYMEVPVDLTASHFELNQEGVVYRGKQVGNKSIRKIGSQAVEFSDLFNVIKVGNKFNTSHIPSGSVEWWFKASPDTWLSGGTFFQAWAGSRFTRLLVTDDPVTDDPSFYFQTFNGQDYHALSAAFSIDEIYDWHHYAVSWVRGGGPFVGDHGNHGFSAWFWVDGQVVAKENFTTDWGIVPLDELNMMGGLRNGYFSEIRFNDKLRDFTFSFESYIERDRVDVAPIIPRQSSISIGGDTPKRQKAIFSQGAEIVDKNFTPILHDEWTLVNSFKLGSGSQDHTLFRGMCADISGGLYVCGNAIVVTGSLSKSFAIIRKSHLTASDDWRTVYQSPGDSDISSSWILYDIIERPTSPTAHSTDHNVYACGEYRTATNSSDPTRGRSPKALFLRGQESGESWGTWGISSLMSASLRCMAISGAVGSTNAVNLIVGGAFASNNLTVQRPMGARVWEIQSSLNYQGDDGFFYTYFTSSVAQFDANHFGVVTDVDVGYDGNVQYALSTGVSAATSSIDIYGSREPSGAMGTFVLNKLGLGGPGLFDNLYQDLYIESDPFFSGSSYAGGIYISGSRAFVARSHPSGSILKTDLSGVSDWHIEDTTGGKSYLSASTAVTKFSEEGRDKLVIGVENNDIYNFVRIPDVLEELDAHYEGTEKINLKGTIKAFLTSTLADGTVEVYGAGYVQSEDSTALSGAIFIRRLAPSGSFARVKVSGDDQYTINRSTVGVNWAHDFAKRKLMEQDRDNE